MNSGKLSWRQPGYYSHALNQPRDDGEGSSLRHKEADPSKGVRLLAIPPKIYSDGVQLAYRAN